MTKVKATQKYIFDNKTRNVGDVFDASQDDANALVTIGQAEYVQEPGGYQDKAMRAADEAKPSPPSSTAARRGRYPRRDMRAED